MAFTNAVYLRESKKRVPTTKAESERYAKQQEAETKMLGALPALCPDKDRVSARLNSSSVDYPLIKSKMGENFYSYDTVKLMACAVDSIFYPLEPGRGKNSASEFTRESVTGLKRIGAESAYGYAILGGVKDASDMYVLKVTQTEEGVEDLTHEYLVGSKLNALRQQGIPNFAVVYGAFRCSSPVISTDKKVTSWCSDSKNNSKVPYVLYENVQNPLSAGEYARTGSINQVFSMYLQVLLALLHAETKLGFTHYDLHPENVLMRPVVGKALFQIGYATSASTNLHIAADRVATLIDYGRSTIKSGADNLGSPVPGIVNTWTYDFPFAIADAYKFLLFLARSVPKGAQVYKQIEIAFRYFNARDSLEVVLRQQWDSRYALPHCEETKGMSLRLLMRHIFSNCSVGNVASNVPLEKVASLECGGRCLSLDILEREAGIKKSVPTPKTIVEYDDIIAYLESHYPELAKKVTQGFKFQPAIDAYRADLSSRLSSLSDTVARIPDASASLRLDTIASLEFVQGLYSSIFNAVFEQESVQNLLAIGSRYTTRDPRLTGSLKQAEAKLAEVSTKLCGKIQLAAMLEASIKRSANELSLRDPKFEWYARVSTEIQDVKGKICKQIANKEVPQLQARQPVAVDHAAVRRVLGPKFIPPPAVSFPTREAIKRYAEENYY